LIEVKYMVEHILTYEVRLVEHILTYEVRLKRILVFSHKEFYISVPHVCSKAPQFIKTYLPMHKPIRRYIPIGSFSSNAQTYQKIHSDRLFFHRKLSSDWPFFMGWAT